MLYFIRDAKHNRTLLASMRDEIRCRTLLSKPFPKAFALLEYQKQITWVKSLLDHKEHHLIGCFERTAA